MTPPLWQKVKRTKPVDESERWEWKSWLKAQHSENEDHGIWPITSWEIDGKTVETVTDLIFLGSRITVDGDCSHEIKRCLLLERKAMTNLDSILKKRDITLLTKVKAMVFLVVMYGCESWTIKKAKMIHWKISWCWERLSSGRERGNREWDDWMASVTPWTWVWASSRR